MQIISQPKFRCFSFYGIMFLQDNFGLVSNVVSLWLFIIIIIIESKSVDQLDGSYGFLYMI